MKGSDWADAVVDGVGAATAGKAAVVPAATAAVLSDQALQFLGVPLNVFLLAFTGALLGLSLHERKPGDSRPSMYVLVLTYTLLGAYGSSLLPHVPKLDFLAKMPQTALALSLALLSHWTFPVVVKEVPAMIQRVFRRIAPGKAEKDGEG